MEKTQSSEWIKTARELNRKHEYRQAERYADAAQRESTSDLEKSAAYAQWSLSYIGLFQTEQRGQDTYERLAYSNAVDALVAWPHGSDFTDAYGALHEWASVLCGQSDPKWRVKSRLLRVVEAAMSESDLRHEFPDPDELKEYERLKKRFDARRKELKAQKRT